MRWTIVRGAAARFRDKVEQIRHGVNTHGNTVREQCLRMGSKSSKNLAQGEYGEEARRKRKDLHASDEQARERTDKRASGRVSDRGSERTSERVSG